MRLYRTLCQVSSIGLLIMVLAALSACRPTSPVSKAQLPVKIQIDAEGLYKLDAADLDLAQSEITALVLSYRGRVLPVWPVETGAKTELYFYAPPRDSQSSPVRYVILAGQAGEGVEAGVWGAVQAEALPEGESQNGQPQAAISYSTLHLEENLIYQPQAEGGERWLWLSMAGGQPGESFKFKLPGAGAGNGRIRLHVWGSTSAPENPDHHLTLSLNGSLLLDESWDGAGRRTLQAEIPAGLLTAGENHLLIVLPGDTGAAAELAYLDWIEVDYPAALEADLDLIDFTSAGGDHHPTGFSGAAIALDVTDPYQPLRVAADARSGWRGEAGRRYLLVGPRAVLRPTAILPLSIDRTLLDSSSGADYLVVGPPDLLAPLQPLIDHRMAQGWSVRVVPLETVYDTFHAGLPEPEAVQALVRSSMAWSPAPRALLLVGDSTFDPAGYITPATANRLPTFFVDTVFGGQTASDLPFALLDDGEHYPLLAVGRLPARTPEQVTIIVEKILIFETAGALAGSRAPRVLAVADPQETSFAYDAQKFLDGFGSEYTHELLTPEIGTASAAQVVEAVQRSGGLVGYFGHGSLNMWGKDRLFSVDEVANLNNGDRLPVFVTLTCLNGLFTHTKHTSLAEALIWQPAGGAAAVLAPTSLTLPSDQAVLSSAFVRAVNANSRITLGEALLSAQRSMSPTTRGQQDVLYTFLLFGDPMMPVFP